MAEGPVTGDRGIPAAVLCKVYSTAELEALLGPITDMGESTPEPCRVVSALNAMDITAGKGDWEATTATDRFEDKTKA
jgi:hypothetical protein